MHTSTWARWKTQSENAPNFRRTTNRIQISKEAISPRVITIVSGLPRSGTSLLMQMLTAGGMTMLTDHERKADVDNPKGYCEWEPAKQLPKEPNRIDEAEGKVVKVISQLLLSVPPGRK